MKKIKYNDSWLFCVKQTGDFHEVTLPHDAMIHEQRDPQAPGGDAYAFFTSSQYVYRKKAGISAAHAYLCFDGVYKDAKVYHNGTLVKEYHYGYCPFTVSLGEIREDDEILVECGVTSPDSRWYPGAGIYRNVFLYISDEEDFIPPYSVRVSTVDETKGLIHVSTENDNAKIEILDHTKVIACAYGKEADLMIADVRLWDEYDPFLYSVRVTSDNDQCTERFGIRKVEKGTDGLYINGHKTLLKGGCIHHDNGLIGACACEESEYRKVRILKEAGFNAIRCAHNPASEALLAACDELGMYVMDEAWDMWYQHKTKNDYASYWQKHHMADLENIVRRDFNHPCVILYSVGNEVSEPSSMKGLHALREMVSFLHRRDPNRLVTAGFNLMIMTNAAKGKAMYDAESGGLNNDTNAMNGMNSTVFNMITSAIGSGMNQAANSKKADRICSPALDMVDIAGYHYASGRYRKDAQLHPERLIFGSETMPYDIGKNWKMVKDLDNLAGDFLWTAWDYIGENGIGAWGYTEDAKTFGKPYPWWLACAGAFDILGNPNAEALWAGAAFGACEKPLIAIRPLNHEMEAVKAAWRGTDGLPSYAWKGCQGKKTIAEVFTDGVYVRLEINGKKTKLKKVKENRALFHIVYEPGTITAISYDADQQEKGRSSLVSASAETQVKVRIEKKNTENDDIVYAAIAVEDENGIVECNADCRVRIEIENGTLLAFGSADPRLTEDLFDNVCTTYYGRAQAVIRRNNTGELKVNAVKDTE